MENQEQQIQQQQTEGKKGKKSILLLVLLLLLVTVTVGYAVLSTSFNIRGESKIVGEWCIDPRGCGDDRCENIETCDPSPVTCPDPEKCIITDCDVAANADKCNCDPTTGICEGPDPIDCTTNPENCLKPNCTVTTTETCECPQGATNCIPRPQIWMDGDTVYFRHVLTKPGDVFTFDATYKNGGNIDAKLATVAQSPLNNYAQNYIDYSVKYSNGSTVAVNDPLNAGDSATYRVRVAYKDTVTTLPDQATLDLINEKAQGHYGATSSFSVTYEQK
jgi:hypothetical protein